MINDPSLEPSFWDSILLVEWPLVISVSIITSLCFLLFLAIIRPIICISKLIFYEEVKLTTGESKRAFKIKIVNWTMFNIYDVNAELSLVERYGDGNSTYSVRYYNVPLSKNNKMFIPSMLTKRGTKNAEYAQIFHTYDNLLSKWTKDSQYLEFRIMSRHGLSGFSKVSVKQYSDRDVLRTGRFKYGRSMKKKE